MIRIFKRVAWKRNKSWPGGWEPYVGRKNYIKVVDTEAEARTFCMAHNDERKSKGETFYEFEHA